ncbi:GL13145 [Drosophila persimilis]|uniref:GL13145 n=1 Tax=Drosophila persimilis TaxID=7234 RepID=B4HBH2_DROPE|nr:GL13145 [Drosophila persimilis]
MYSNSTAWFSGAKLRVHLDIQVGEHAILGNRVSDLRTNDYKLTPQCSLRICSTDCEAKATVLRVIGYSSTLHGECRQWRLRQTSSLGSWPLPEFDLRLTRTIELGASLALLIAALSSLLSCVLLILDTLALAFIHRVLYVIRLDIVAALRYCVLNVLRVDLKPAKILSQSNARGTLSLQALRSDPLSGASATPWFGMCQMQCSRCNDSITYQVVKPSPATTPREHPSAVTGKGIL